MQKLLERSNKVIATARVPQEAQQLQQLAAENSNLTVAALDVSQPDSIQAFAAEVKRHTQHVDVSVPLGSLLPLHHDSTCRLAVQSNQGTHAKQSTARHKTERFATAQPVYSSMQSTRPHFLILAFPLSFASTE